MTEASKDKFDLKALQDLLQKSGAECTEVTKLLFTSYLPDKTDKLYADLKAKIDSGLASKELTDISDYIEKKYQEKKEAFETNKTSIDTYVSEVAENGKKLLASIGAAFKKN